MLDFMAAITVCGTPALACNYPCPRSIPAVKHVSDDIDVGQDWMHASAGPLPALGKAWRVECK